LNAGLKKLPTGLEYLTLETCCHDGSWLQDYEFLQNDVLLNFKNLKSLHIALNCDNLTDDVIQYGFLKLPRLEELRLIGMPNKFTPGPQSQLTKKLKKYDIITAGMISARSFW